MSRPVKLEPVAWRWQTNYTDDTWHYAEKVSFAPRDIERGIVRNITPLFAAPPRSDKANAQLDAAMRDALQWYAEQVGNCRKLPGIPEGEAARKALDKDGGIRARYALGVGTTFKYGTGLRSTPEQTNAALSTSPAVPNTVGEDKL